MRKPVHPAASIERHLREDLAGDEPDLLGRGDVSTVLQIRAAHICNRAGDGGQCLAGEVVDQLRVNVLVGTKHAQARTLGRSEQLGSRAELPPLEPGCFEFVFVGHGRLSCHARRKRRR
jgi:hypothetical protein